MCFNHNARICHTVIFQWGTKLQLRRYASKIFSILSNRDIVRYLIINTLLPMEQDCLITSYDPVR